MTKGRKARDESVGHNAPVDQLRKLIHKLHEFGIRPIINQLGYGITHVRVVRKRFQRSRIRPCVKINLPSLHAHRMSVTALESDDRKNVRGARSALTLSIAHKKTNISSKSPSTPTLAISAV